MPTTCALCRRIVPDEQIDDPQVVQEHHLRPERRVESPTVMLCRPCHDQIHAVFTNEELREEYDTVDALQSADRLQAYLDWIRGTEKLDIEVRTSNRVRDRR
ncbi:MAG: 5-methylcytosine-specific restriction protein A [Natronomonas sp.]|jgi:5-methylcytosine-specific restriction protein A